MLRVFKLVSLATLIALFLNIAARAEYPLAYVGPTDIRDYSLSPDGHSVAILEHTAKFTFTGTDTWNEIRIKRAVDGHTQIISRPKERFYFWISWGVQDTLIAQGIQFYREDGAGEWKARNTLYGFDPETGKERVIYEDRAVDADSDEAPPIPEILAISTDNREAALMVETSNGYNLIAVNFDSGSRRLLDRGNSRVLGWEVDENLVPYLRFEEGRRENEQRVYTRTPAGEWTLERAYNPMENDFQPASRLTEGQKMLVVHRPEEAQVSGLYIYDFAQNTYSEKIFENPGHDVVTVRRNSFTGELLYIGWWEDKLTKKWFDEEIGTIAAKLDGAFKPADNWSVLETSEDGRRWLLYVSSPTRPGSLFQFDVDTMKARFVANLRPDLKSNHVFELQRIDYTAQDGLPLFGYFIEGRIGPDAPLIVHPHGGPVARDHADFDGMAQYLAYLGYNIFQPQFRGSGELGRDFEEAGFGEWGYAMQTDMDDGVAALEEAGLINPESARLIVGASYGGYAAMAGATITPDKYACVVSINGVSDLTDFINQFSEDDEADRAVREIWIQRIGNPDTDPDAVKAISPRTYVGNIKAEILLIHGDEDDIVHVDQSRETFRLLQEYDVSSIYHELEGAGHSVRDKDQRAEMLMLIQRFLYGCQSPWN